MTAFLFLQKFDGNVPVTLPYAPIMDRLSRVGKLGCGRGDMEVTLPPDAMAATCTIIGSAEEGITCIGFERPRFDAGLRELVWECMTQFGCAVFDDTLATLYTTPQGQDSLPAGLLLASRTGARRITSAQQLWPDDFEVGQPAPPRPALRYANANIHGPDLQLFDYAGPGGMELYIEIGMRAQACNPATLRVLRNVGLRIDAAITVNPQYAVVYRYSEHATSLLLLESATVAELANRVTIASPALGEERNPDGFVADREVFASEDGQAAQFIRYAQETYGLAFDAGMPAIEALAGLLDQAHGDFCREREQHGNRADFISLDAMAWARRAGGYLGHFIVQHVGAQWGYVTRAQQRVLVLRTHGGRICCPHHMVLDHVINGAADSVVPLIRTLMRDQAESTPRGEDLVCQIPVLCQQLRGQREFDGGQDLPLAHLLPRGRLDFSVPSLHQLDQYLACLATGLSSLSDQALTDAILCAGAYLGETIRSNTDDNGYWQWMTYEQVAQRDPDFAQSRPREMTLLAVLDSPQHFTYPFAHVAAILTGTTTSTAHAYACTLGASIRQAGPKARREEEVESALEETERHAAWSAQMRRDEERQATGSSKAGVALLVMILLVLAYSAKAALTAFSAVAAMGPGESLLYGAWIAGPSLFMAGVACKIRWNFVPMGAMLCGSVLLSFFGASAYHINLALDSAPQGLTVYQWVPLVQFIWAGGWTLMMRRHIGRA